MMLSTQNSNRLVRNEETTDTTAPTATEDATTGADASYFFTIIPTEDVIVTILDGGVWDATNASVSGYVITLDDIATDGDTIIFRITDNAGNYTEYIATVDYLTEAWILTLN